MDRVSRELEEIVTLLTERPQTVTLAELMRVCEHYFGGYRQRGSHRKFRTGLAGYPVVNIQPRGKMAKPYQCRQVAEAIAMKNRGGG